MPPFHERLGLIGKQVLQYQHMYPLIPDVQLIAELLKDKYMPGRTAAQWVGGGGGGG